MTPLADTPAPPECTIAMDLAQAAFASTNAGLIWPRSKPAAEQAVVLLPTRDPQRASPNWYLPDSGVFEVIQHRETRQRASGDKVVEYTLRRRLFWQRSPDMGRRLVIVERPHSWRGDWYYSYEVASDLTREAFLEAIREERSLNLVLDGHRWHPPAVLQSPDTGALWLVDRSAHALDPWRVYVPSDAGLVAGCEIAFWPESGSGLEVLPAAVQRFARLADEALGPGRNEGTLQPTARIRYGVARRWQVVSDRPWALTQAPSNSRAEVDAGLASWVEKGGRAKPARARVLAGLQRAEPRAAQALASYLQTRFKIGETEAEQYSRFAIDVMLRSYFSFPGERRRSRDPIQAPWPAAVR